MQKIHFLLVKNEKIPEVPSSALVGTIIPRVDNLSGCYIENKRKCRSQRRVSRDVLEKCLQVLMMRDFEDDILMFNVLCHENDRNIDC